MTIPETIGLRILKTRQARKMTALKLAALAGVHRNTVSRIEAGERQPLLENLWRICRVLGISLDSLFEEVKPAAGVQLEFEWPRREYGTSKLSGKANRGSNDLPAVRSRLGSQRLGASSMPPKRHQEGGRVSIQTLTRAIERAARARDAAGHCDQMRDLRDRSITSGDSIFQRAG